MVIFIDIDGTLSCGKNHVSELVKEAIRQARRNGHQVVLCTGRNRCDIEPLMYIGFDGAICSGGGYIEMNGQEIFHSYNPKEDVQKAIEVLNQNHSYYKLESDYCAFQDDEMILMFNRYSDDLTQYKITNHIYPVSSFEDERIQTIYFFTPGGIEEIRDKLGSLFSFYVYNQLDTGYYECELMNKDVNKGIGVLKVLEYLNEPIEHSIGFGDSQNDYHMLTTVGISVVMDNGSEELKRIATSVCESVENDGIYHELVRRGLVDEI